MQTTEDFLLEIGCEELPAKQLPLLSDALLEGMRRELQKAELSFAAISKFATPRRLAICVTGLALQQPARLIEKKGPSLQAAYTSEGQPTPATMGFAKSCGVDVTALQTRKTDKGDFLFFIVKEEGKPTVSLLPELVNQVIAKLPIAKRMRWGWETTEFLRPVRWVLMLLGNKVIDANVLGLKTQSFTYGHRFHHPEAIVISHPQQYESQLERLGYVIPDFTKRRNLIEKNVIALAKKMKGVPVIGNDLLDEVTGIVEWPVVLTAHFDARFLQVPKEALITSMEEHQKCFAVKNTKDELLPIFITVSNIESMNETEVIHGNECVMRARLSDAEFFYQNDLKIPLENNLEQLKTVIFQAKLGSVYDKSQRIAHLSKHIAGLLNTDESNAFRAGLLCKADLMSQMVGEFPELQGTMGYYYALNAQEKKEVADAIKEHYDPHYAGGDLPASSCGAVVAIADKMDTLVGIFGLNQAPTGEKDPFALRRAALGILRIMIEKQLPLDLFAILHVAHQQYAQVLPNQNVANDVFEFMLERLRAFYADKQVSADVFAAVMAKKPRQPYDFHRRLLAVTHFKKLPEAASLAAANKRVSNILSKNIEGYQKQEIEQTLLSTPAEKELVSQLIARKKQIKPLLEKGQYQEILCFLAGLRPAIDAFFDNVMVMTDDLKLRNNRLAILSELRELFLDVADIALIVEENLNVEINCPG